MITLTVILAFLKKAYSVSVAFLREVWKVIGMQRWEVLVVVGCIILVLLVAFSYCDKQKPVEIRDTRGTITVIQSESDEKIKERFEKIDKQRMLDDAKIREAQRTPTPKKNVTAQELEEKARGKK